MIKHKGKKELKEHQFCNCDDCGENHRWCVTHDKCECEHCNPAPKKPFEERYIKKDCTCAFCVGYRKGRKQNEKPLGDKRDWKKRFNKKFPDLVEVIRGNPFSGFVRNKDIKAFIRQLLAQTKQDTISKLKAGLKTYLFKVKGYDLERLTSTMNLIKNEITCNVNAISEKTAISKAKKLFTRDYYLIMEVKS